MSWYSDKENPSKWLLERTGDGDSHPGPIHCENCQYYREDFDVDDNGNTFEFCRCGITDDLLDTTERDSCKDFLSFD